MNAAIFAEQIKAMFDRWDSFYTGTKAYSLPTATLISSALKELGVAAERLQIAVELMLQQQQKLDVLEKTIAVQHQRYQDLLEFVPGACLITNSEGIVQAANQTAGDLLRIKPSLLLGQSLLRFITPETLSCFQSQLEQIHQCTWQPEWQLCLQPQHGIPIQAIARIKVSDSCTDTPPTVSWGLREITGLQGRESLYVNCSRHCYEKGEIIPLDLQVLWQVCQGLVKLSTFSNKGEEMLAGLAGAGSPFGASLVASPIYQAIALRDTQLWRIPLTELAAFPELAQSLLPHIGQRLRQSETLLAIYGQQRVEDRLSALLLFLKQEIGEPLAEGTRLPIRFSHAELANACGTTRVTITRTLGQFVRQQKVSVDEKQHLVVSSTLSN